MDSQLNNQRNKCWKYEKKMWEPFWSYLLNNTANPVHFHSNWPGLAELFSRELPNDSNIFFHIFSIHFFNHLIENPKTTNALTFLTHNISAIGGVGHKSFASEWGRRTREGDVRFHKSYPSQKYLDKSLPYLVEPFSPIPKSSKWQFLWKFW